MPEEDMKNIINYINKLDYDKYAKDMEIREALQLIKNKMEREAQDKEANQKVDGNNKVVNETEKNKLEQNNEDNQKEIQKHKEELNDNTNNNKEKSQPTIKAKPIIDENKMKREQEKQNFKVVEKIAKNEGHINFSHLHYIHIYIIMFIYRN